MIYYGISLLLVYIQALCQMKNPRIETGYANTTDMNIELVKKFNSQPFTEGSATLKLKFYIPKKFHRSTSSS